MLRLLEQFIRDVIKPCEIFISRSVQIALFVLIRHSHELPFFDIILLRTFATSYTFGWITLMHCGAIIPKSSSLILTSWKKHLQFQNKREKKIWNKTMKSVTPSSIKVGDFYSIKHNMVMKTGSLFIRGTIRLLVAFKKKYRNRN